MSYSSYSAMQFDSHNDGSHNDGGRPRLQHCADCGAVQYPSREVCRSCLSAQLEWRPLADDIATVVTNTQVHHSLDDFYTKRAPWHITSVQLPSSSGALLVHSAKKWQSGEQVRIAAVRDNKGSAALFAIGLEEDAEATWRDLTRAEPKDGTENKND